MREELAEKLRLSYMDEDIGAVWRNLSPDTKKAWLRVADVAISMIETTVAHARPDSVRKGHEMRQALWTIIEEAQIALRAD